MLRFQLVCLTFYISVSPEGQVSLTPNITITEVYNNVTLTCSVIQSNSTNMFQWEHNNSPLNLTSTLLTISNVSVEDGGNYVCIVSNTAGEGNATATIYIQPRITAYSEGVKTSNGSVAEITCNAEGYPAPNITWERVDENNNVTVAFESAFTLSPVVFGNEGNYQCVATTEIEASTFTVSELATLTS